MTRHFHLHPHLTAEELAARDRHTTDPVEARRWQLVRLLAQGETIKTAAATVCLTYSYAKTIAHRYNQEGPTSLRNRSRDKVPPPPRRLLTKEQQEDLVQALAGRPADGGLWSGPKVARWIAAKTGREQVRPQRGWDYLRRCGHTPHVPRPRHHQADPAEQAAFKKTSPTWSPSAKQPPPASPSRPGLPTSIASA